MAADEKGKLMKTESVRGYSLVYRAFTELHELALKHVPAGELPEWVCDIPVGSLKELAVMRAEAAERDES